MTSTIGHISFRYCEKRSLPVNPGHVQDPSSNTFPEDERLGDDLNCTTRTGGTACGTGSACVFKMSNDDNAHIANCSGQSLPDPTSYDATLCCQVREVCTDGKDNDGDGLVDCADPECNEATPGGGLDPWSDTTPEVCHPNSCPATLHVDLEGFWQFENNTNDNSENSNDASLKGSASYTTEINGRLGRAVELDGSNDYVQVPDDTSFYQTLDPGAELTLSAYIYAENDSSQHGIIGKGLSAPYQLYVDSGQYTVNLDTASGSPSETFGSVNESAWQHVAVTYNGSSGGLSGYVDGTEVLDTTVSSGDIVTSSNDVFIGSLGSASGFFDGRIDQPRIYNRSLSSSEVSSFTTDKCNNRQRTLECVESPELCNTTYNSNDGYHCSYGKFDDPQNTDYSDPSKDGTGLCCPKDRTAEWDDFNDKWTCVSTDTCGVGPGTNCEAAITSNQSRWLSNKSNGTSNACNSQVPNLHEDFTETKSPEGSQACCYVPKSGVKDYWYKDGNVKIYG